MKYDLDKPHDKTRFINRVNFLMNNSKFVELKEVSIKTSRQNNYLHLLLTFFALEHGDTMDYVKREIYKIKCNPDIFVVKVPNRITGEIREGIRSTDCLEKEEMTLSISRFKERSAIDYFITLPDAEDKEFHKWIMIEAEKQKQWL